MQWKSNASRQGDGSRLWDGKRAVWRHIIFYENSSTAKYCYLWYLIAKLTGKQAGNVSTDIY